MRYAGVLVLVLLAPLVHAADAGPLNADRRPEARGDVTLFAKNPRLVHFRLRMVEASITKCRRLGFYFDFAAAQQGIVADDAQAAFVDFLIEHDLARVLADPQIEATPGRPAQFFAGGTTSPSMSPSGETQPGQEFGTRATISDLSVEGNRIRASVVLSVKTLDAGRAIPTQAGTNPTVLTRKFAAPIEAISGDTQVLGGLRSHRHRGDLSAAKGEDEETVLVVLITTELVGEPNPATN
ncbi:MAG: hypothetical protein KDA44_22115 [Planctomycetales bacterium]|nr:hypothetical protein [Planctomycetales bacterium]